MIKRWKARLDRDGFRPAPEDQEVFERTQGFVQQSVWEGRSKFEKNRIQINLAVSIRDQFLEPPAYVVVLVAHLQADGIALMNRGEGRWWEEAEESSVMKALFDYGIPWLEENGNTLRLTTLLEQGIQEASFPPPVFNRYLSLLYFETGQPLIGCKYAQAYLDHVTLCDLPDEPERTLRQLTACKSFRSSSRT